jgi:hypothetical protein
MPFTVEEFRDLVHILEERPEWRAELRRLVLTDELLTLPQQVAELRAQTEQRFQELIEAQRRTEEQVATLTAAQRRTEEQVAALTVQVTELTTAQQRIEGQIAALTRVVRTLVDDVGELKGDNLENRYRTKVYAFFSRLIRRAHVLSADELTTLLDEALDNRTLSEAEADEIALADLVVRGKRREDGTEVYLVVEVSWGVGPKDVERAAERAALLAKLGPPALPVVAGRKITPDGKRLARTQHVWQLTDGRAVPPEPTTEPAV